MATRWRSPPESSSGRWSRRWPSWTRSSSSAARSWTLGRGQPLVRRPRRVSAVDLAHGPSDCASVLHHGYSRYARLLQREAWLRLSGDVAGSAGLCHRGARPAGDSLPLRRAAHSQSGQYQDALLDAYLFVEDADALYAEY